MHGGCDFTQQQLWKGLRRASERRCREREEATAAATLRPNLRARPKPSNGCWSRLNGWVGGAYALYDVK
jgi:hypothetical protein